MSVFTGVLVAADRPLGPDQIYGPLFADVQRARCFEDQKAFSDAVPRSAPEKILSAYREAQAQGAFDPCRFAREHFLLPESPTIQVPAAPTLEAHLGALWPLLRRSPDRVLEGASLLPLPHPYIVPGGRFREIYYWDSYFTLLGLRESGDEEMIASMVDNFAYLLRTFGRIPNGNRTYYLSRSQPPFFALMVELLAEKKGASVYRQYLPELLREYEYWEDRSGATRHRVVLGEGRSLNRYFDEASTPRAEAFAHDEETARRSRRPAPEVYQHLRAACESGWDFSTRWFASGGDLTSIRTLDLIPVDLNCLLVQLERTLSRACEEADDSARAQSFAAAAEQRRQAILAYCWSEDAGFFCDYDLEKKHPSPVLTLAGLYPLFFGIASPEQAQKVADRIQKEFLKPGGLVTTLSTSGQQWDAPNGWAPLQWIGVSGLRRYGHDALAAEIARRWIALNVDVYRRTGKLMEKYNVEDTSLEAGGGEYAGQDGFGWTNGVLLKLMKMYGAPQPSS